MLTISKVRDVLKAVIVVMPRPLNVRVVHCRRLAAGGDDYTSPADCFRALVRRVFLRKRIIMSRADERRAQDGAKRVTNLSC